MQVCTRAHTGQSLHCSYTQRMYAHVCMQVCACVCTHSLCVGAVKTLVSVCTCARTGQSLHCSYIKECVHMFAYLHAQMCTHSLCVRAVKTVASVRMRAYRAASIKKAHAASIKKAHASVHTCAHWPESSLLIHTKNVCTCVHASVRMCVHTFFVCTSSEDSGRACVHTCMGLFYGRCNNQQYLMCFPIPVSMRITPS